MDSSMVTPSLAGDSVTLMPASRMAAILVLASPLPPEMMAPAWPGMQLLLCDNERS